MPFHQSEGKERKMIEGKNLGSEENQARLSVIPQPLIYLLWSKKMNKGGEGIPTVSLTLLELASRRAG